MAHLHYASEGDERQRNGIYVSRCAALSVALLNVFLLVTCLSLLLILRGTSVEVEVHRVRRQFAGAGPDRQPGSRDPEPGDPNNPPWTIYCRSLDQNSLLNVCYNMIQSATTSSTSTSVVPGISQPTTRPRRLTPAAGAATTTTSSSSSTATTTFMPSTTTELIESDDAPDNLRLPRHLRPFHYDIRWTPDFYGDNPGQFTLNGSVGVYFRCHSPSAVVSLNYHRRLLIDSSSIKVTSLRNNSLIPLVRIDENLDQQVYNITLNRPLQVGEEILVALRFVGFIENGPYGVYWSQYSNANGTRYLVSTQFETTEARRAFPCVDDPAAKATFTLSIDRQMQMRTLANTPLNYTTAPYNGNSTWVTDVFQKTKPMSTYLVAFAIFDYTNVTVYSAGNNPVKIGLWAQNDFVNAGYLSYSAIVAPASVDFFGNYFNYPYNWPKLDMTSIPKMSFGGMENWGLITYQPNRLLFDETESDTEERMNVALTVSHEILHNWLGNTVTIKWWDDLWLTEGTARYFQFLGVQNVHPTWDVDQLFVDQTFYTGAMWNDDSGSADPVYNPHLETNGDLDSMFSSITYNKGGTVVRMLRKLLVGDDAFREAFKKYVVDYQYSNVIHSDLFWEMAEAYKKSGGVMDFDVTEVLSTWILQQGFPLVTVTRGQSGPSTQLILTQNLFLYPLNATSDDYQPPPYGYLWEIPVTYITSYNSNPVRVWMHKERTITVPLTGSLAVNDWVLVNHNLYGYYRVNYDDVNWLSLATQLKSDHTKIPVNNRAQLIEDSFTLSMSSNLSQTIGLKLSEYLSNETEYLPWEMFKENIAPFLRRISSDDQLYTRMQNYILSRLQNTYQRLGWDAAVNDNITVIFLRRLMLELACGADFADCVNTAFIRFQLWKANGFINTIVTPDQRFAVYCAVAANGSYGDWELLVSRYQATLSHFSDESNKLAEALTCTKNITTLTRLLQSIQRQEQSIVSYRDFNNVLYFIALTKQGYDLAWEHLTRYGVSTLGRVDILKSFSSIISTTAEAARFDAYVNQYPSQNNYENSSFASFRNTIQQNIIWRQRNEQSFRDWLTALGF